MDGSRTHLILRDSEVPLPLGHHSDRLLTAHNGLTPVCEENRTLAISIKSRAPRHSATVPEFGASGWNRTNCLTIKNRLLILMSFERMVLALGVEPSPCSNLERSGL